MTFAGNLLANRLICELEPKVQPSILALEESKQVAERVCSARPGRLDTLRPARSREKILGACQIILSQLDDHEELIVAFGRAPDGAADATFDSFWRVVGERSSVGFSPALRREIKEHLKSEDRVVLVIHNHPNNPIKTALKSIFGGWVPIPSSTDRELAWAANMEVLRRICSGREGARFEWYLVDEGRISRFYMPSVERTVRFLSELFR